jgi:hypothetical protein
MSRESSISRSLWWLADASSNMLDSNEREAVHGDLAESLETGGQALRHVLGLVIRRQIAFWRGWQPWVCLFSLVVPLGTLLSLVCRSMADGSAVYIWLYANNWDWAFVHNAAFLRNLFSSLTDIFLSYLELACWAWNSGFLLASLSRRTIWFSGAVFCLVLLFVQLLGGPQFLRHSFVLLRTRDTPGHAVVFALGFYRVLFPLITHAALVLVPSVWGMRQGLRLGTLPRSVRTSLWICALVAVAALLTQNLAWWMLRVWQVFPLRYPRLPSLMPYSVLGPTMYLLATTRSRHSQRREAVS